MASPFYTRTMRPEFAQYLSYRGGWPKVRDVLDAMRASGYKVTEKNICELHGLREVKAPCAQAYVNTIIISEHRGLARARSALRDYLKECGFSCPEAVSIDTVLPIVCTEPIYRNPGQAQRFKDWLVGGAEALAVYPMARILTDIAAPWSFESDLDAVVEWIYAAMGRDLATQPDTRDEQYLSRLGQQTIRENKDKFASRCKAWFNHNPWLVVTARQGNLSHGVSIMLPTTPEVYAEVRRGSRSLVSINVDEIRVPSQHVIFLAAAENPALLKKREDPTWGMLLSIAAQHGALLRYKNEPGRRKFSFLAPNATGKNSKRLESVGYRGIGTDDPESGREIWERVIDFDKGEGARYIDGPLLEFLGKVLPHAPRLF